MSKIWSPHNYQLTAISFLLKNKVGGLFLDPGLGKTSTSLATLKILINAGLTKGVLMIAPLRVCYSVWPGEIQKWKNFNSISHTILHDKTKKTLWGDQKDIYVINPEGLPWLMDELLSGLQLGRQCPFDTLWIDESTKFKSHDTKTRFKIIKDMIPLFKRRYIMTGTPAPRSLLDLWSQIYILDEGQSLTKNFYHFRNRYFHTNDWNKYSFIINDGAADKIHQAVSPLILEMKAEDYLDMPELIFNNIMVQLPSKALKQYKKMEQEFFLELDGGEVTAEAAAQASLKCHQIANGCVYEDIPENLPEEQLASFKRNRKTLFIHKAKIEALKDLIDELNGKPLLIGYQFRHDLQSIQKLLGKDVPHIGSGVSNSKMKQIEEDWNAGKLPILVGHPGSMGHGLNLQSAGNDVCWFSLTWNLEDYEQFYRRVYRQGVKGNSVRVHHLIAQNTLDEAMIERLGEKAKNQEDLRKALRMYRQRSNLTC